MINESYYSITNEVKDAFRKNNFVELKKFLTGPHLAALKKAAAKVALKKEYQPVYHSFSRGKIAVDQEISDFVNMIVGTKPKVWELWSFSWKDYTVVNDESIEGPGFDAIIDLGDWNDKYGGEVVYVDGSGDYTKINSEKNMLVLVERKKGVHRFVRYVNHHSKDKKRLFLIARFL